MRRFFRHNLTLALAAITCLVLFTACPFAESFDDGLDYTVVKYDIAVANASDATIFAIVDIVMVVDKYDYEGNLNSNPQKFVSFNPQVHPADSPYFIELGPGESCSYRWKDYRHKWDCMQYTVYVVTDHTFNTHTPEEILSEKLFDEVIVLSGPEIEENQFRITYTGDNL